jgi:hypothetical protein
MDQEVTHNGNQAEQRCLSNMKAYEEHHANYPPKPAPGTRGRNGSRHCLFTAVLALGLATLVQSARSRPALVGEWLTGSTNLGDVSGYSPTGTHDGYIIGAGNYVFTNDVPPGKLGQSLFFYNSDTGLAISNSSTLDAGYKDTFDNRINQAMTVIFWGKGWPGGWYPWVSKYGEDGAGWQLRSEAQTGDAPCWTIRGTGGTVTIGSDLIDGPEDLVATGFALNDGYWHYYAGTYDAVTGVRNLYIDGILAAQETNNGTYNLAPVEHLCIGAKDNPPGNNFNYFSTFEIYDVRIFNYAPPTTGGIPLAWRVIPGSNGDELVLIWPWGTLLQATSLAGPWWNVLNTSPYTNSASSGPMFFKVNSPGPEPL